MTDDHDIKRSQGDLEDLGTIFDGMQGILSGLKVVQAEPEAKPKSSKGQAPKVELAKAASEISGMPSRAERAYMARELVQCTLPLRDPKDATVWARKNGNYTLIIQSGIDEETMMPRGLPY